MTNGHVWFTAMDVVRNKGKPFRCFREEIIEQNVRTYILLRYSKIKKKIQPITNKDIR